MDQELKNKELFEGDNIEEELNKLEAEIEENGSLDDDITSIDHEKTADKRIEAVELDRADFLLEEEKEKEEGGEELEADSPNPDVEQTSHPISRWYLNKNIIGFSIIALVVVVSFVIYISMGKTVAPDKGKQKDPAVYGSVRGRIDPPEKKVPLPDPPLTLSSFIIPVDKGTDDAYLLLSISMMSPNSKVYGEIKRKRAFLRGALYDLLKEMVNGGKVKIVPQEEIKREIVKVVNKLLSSGKIEKVYFTDFLLV